jgi:hypothetical protein
MLTLRQRAQYAVFEERFRSEIRKMIGEVRGARGADGGSGELQRDGDGQGQRQGQGQGSSGKGRR